MNIFHQLSEYGKELLRSLDPGHQLDHLECSICLSYFNLKDKRPVILCRTKVCAQQHPICEMCLIDMIKVKDSDGIQQPLRCPYCKEFGYEKYKYDQSQNDLIAKLVNIMEMLEHITNNTKKFTQEQSQKRLKEVVEKAQKDIFNLSSQEKRKRYLVERLKRKIQSTTKQKEEVLKEVSARQLKLQQQEQTFRQTKERLMIGSKKHEQVLEAKNLLIEQLQSQNRRLKERLSEYEDISTLQRRVVNRRKPHHEKPNTIFIEDAFYTQFTFNPLRNQIFLQNFNEKRPKMIIELKQERQKYFNAIGERKNVYHSEFFDYDNQQNRLICFQVKSHNKNVVRYKFGLADHSLKQIKSANLFFSLDTTNEEQPFTITFYVNLAKMRLYATASTTRKCEKIGPNIKVGKFTVFIYFFDLKTQITLS